MSKRKPVKAVVINPSGSVLWAEVTGLTHLQKLVGGNIEGISLGTSGQFAYLNEDGIALGLRYNRTATSLCDKYRVGLNPTDFIKGPMVVVGPADENGEDTDVSDQVLKDLGLIM